MLADMEIHRFNQLTFREAYGVLCAPSPSENRRNALTPTYCRIPIGGQTVAHAHFEVEIFHIIKGTGLMCINEKEEVIQAGDLIHISPHQRHQLHNTGPEELHFLSVYSEDFDVPSVPTATLITAAPPTPNGPLHLGHISGPYLAADVIARALRMTGASVHSHTGTDDHQNYVSERASSLNKTLPEFQKQMRARIREGLGNMSIQFDEVIEPLYDLEYQDRIRAFAHKAVSLGVIQLEEVAMPFDEQHKIFLFDALIDGVCPRCKKPSRGGCEDCGRVVPPQELQNAKSTRTGQPPTLRTTKLFTFDLSKHLPLIEDDLRQLPLPRRLRTLVEDAQNSKNLKVLVTVPENGSDGILLPEFNQRAHVWFEMAAHYEKFARDDRNWIHCFGFDNAFYYLLFIPSLLRAMDKQAKLPDAVLTNEFLLLDGQKFSTSRGHAIWADEFSGNTDHLRFYLSLNRPAMAEMDFVPTHFEDFSSDLAQRLGEAKSLGASVKGLPDPSATILVQRTMRDLEYFLSPRSFDSQRAALRLQELIHILPQWRYSPASLQLILRVLATGLTPFMPNEAKHLRQHLGIAKLEWPLDWSAS